MPLKFFNLVLLFCAVSPYLAWTQQAFSLSDAKEYAIRHTESLKLATLNLQDADAQISEYWASGTPTISGRAVLNHFIELPVSLVPGEFFGGAPGSFIPLRFGTSNSINAGIDANALLFSGSFIKGLQAQKLYKELTMKQKDVAIDTVLSNVTKAYMAVLVVQKNIEFAEKNLVLLQNSVRESLQFFEAGYIEKLDLDRLRLSLQSLQNQLLQLQSQEMLTKNLLKFQMGFPIQEEIQLTDALDLLTAEAMTRKIDPSQSIDFSRLPQYGVIQMGVELNKVNVGALQFGYLPTLTATATHQALLGRNELFNRDELGWFTATFVGLNLNVPIFDGLDKKAKIQRAKIDLEKAKIQKNQFERATEIQIANAKIQVINTRNQVNLYLETIDLSKLIYQTAQKKFIAGAGSSFELIQTEQDLYAAQAQYINSLYELIVAMTNLKTALGEIRE
jgi:outer membrane protein TolC